MSNFFLGQIALLGFNFNPRGWALAQGQILPLAQNTALFSLLGTTYGGNGQSTFGLPDLRGRTPIDFSNNTSMGEIAGTENVTLTINEMPGHSHQFNVVPAAGGAAAAANHTFAVATHSAPANAYHAAPGNVVLNPASVSIYGGSQPHSNQQPSLVMNFSIATTGYYPSRN